MSQIHTDTVQETIGKYAPNRILNAPPPMVDQTALKLERKDRSLLSQLRSGFSKVLNNYMARVDPSIPDECPKCKISPHDTNHLFICPNASTTLTVRDLWNQPQKVLEFLQNNGYT